MLHARVIGSATTTLRHRSLEGCKLLIVQPYMRDRRTPDGEPVLAVDRIGAGVGNPVIITSDGKFVRQTLDCETTPVRWSVLAIDDDLRNPSP
jgi:ethanolamine utilization protein EutN